MFKNLKIRTQKIFDPIAYLKKIHKLALEKNSKCNKFENEIETFKKNIVFENTEKQQEESKIPKFKFKLQNQRSINNSVCITNFTL